nr:hypothetical protein [Tanacetum cinerariifolium]
MSQFLPGHYSQTTLHTHTSSPQTLRATTAAVQTIDAFFAGRNVLSGQPVLSVGSGSVTVLVPYYTLANQAALGAESLQSLQVTLTRLFNTPVSLRLVRLTAPYLDAHILAAYLSAELATGTFSQVVRRLFTLVSPVSSGTIALPAYLVGLKVRLGGRLTKEKSRPRMTVQTAQLGSLAVSRTTLTHTAAHTAVNLKGTFTIKVWLCQRAPR